MNVQALARFTAVTSKYAQEKQAVCPGLVFVHAKLHLDVLKFEELYQLETKEKQLICVS